ncbi:MAG TPA: 5'/3'-nucleotidase SurE [Microthrixaceae bacterium]|nr:5'/3'-nucleotidase SurE [Microthrixaceae bacterium]
MKFTRGFALLAATAVIALGAGACSSSDTDSAGTTKAPPSSEAPASTDAPAKKLTILVSNDDGYAAPGIDAVVQALAALPDTEIVVSAPATQQSGMGSKVTEGELTATDEKTKSGHDAHAVVGTPADSVNWALDGGIDVKPDLVVAGINQGQNLGMIGDKASGTIGAARAAVAHGIPALAASMGIHSVDGEDAADYTLAATYVVKWVEERRADILDGKLAGDAPLIENMNIPSCNDGGEIRGVAEVTLADTADGALLPDQNCKSTIAQPADDITAFNNGFVAISPVPAQPPAA